FSVSDPATGNSSTGTVQIQVLGQSRGYLTPHDIQVEVGVGGWPKMNHDTLNTGEAPWFQRAQSRITDTTAFGSPGIRTFSSTTLPPDVGPPVYRGSRVLGAGRGGEPALFVEPDNGLPADPYYENGLQAVSAGGQVLWNNPSFSRPNVPYQT